MIVDMMHKHRRLIIVLMIVFVGVPLALMTVPGSGRGNSRAGLIDPSFPVAKVASTPITAEEFFRHYNQLQQQRSQGGLPVSAVDLVNDGSVEAILDSLIQQAIIANQTAEQPIYPEREYLTARLQQDTFFQNPAGEFDRGYYNQWVKANTRGGGNWDTIYNTVANGVNHEVYLTHLGAAARVLESEIRDEFEAAWTKLRIKTAAIEPKVELTEEDLQKQYDDNLANYMTLEERQADFLAVSLKPPRPEIVGELIERARSGEDFAELAREHSQSLDKNEGGDMGWIAEEDLLGDHQSVLLELGVGGISDAVESPVGIYIYKVEEERTNDEGAREFHARQITIRPELSQEEREARMQRAQDLLAAAIEEDGDLEAVSLLDDVEFKSSGPFTATSPSIDNIPNTDAFSFQQAMVPLAIGQLSEVIVGRSNLYIGVVTEVLEPIQQTFEEVREKVETDATSLYKSGPEYATRLADYISTIQEDAEDIEAIQELLPELDLEIKETKEFELADNFLIEGGLFLSTQQVYQLLVDKEPGDLAGPIIDFARVTHFIELVERIAPDESIWEDERGRLHDALQSRKRIGHQSDYLLFLTEQASNEALIQKDYSAIYSLLGLDDTGADASPEDTFPEPEDTQEEIVLDLDEEEQDE